MLKIAIILAVVCLVFRWAFGQWPWTAMSSKPTRAQKLFKARKLLSIEEGAGRDQILAAHKRVLARVHPDKGGSSAQVHEANDARDLLLSELPGGGSELPGEDPPQDLPGSQD